MQNYSVENDTKKALMCSFDIISWFTNIPLKTTLKTGLDRMYGDEEVAPLLKPE